jgi:hypothetical protein
MVLACLATGPVRFQADSTEECITHARSLMSGRALQKDSPHVQVLPSLQFFLSPPVQSILLVKYKVICCGMSYRPFS